MVVCSVGLARLLVFILVYGAHGKLDTHFTLRSTWGRLHLSSTGAETVIRCTSYDTDPSEMKFGRVMDAGNGLELPPFYREFGSQKPPFGRALHMGSINGSIRFGAYYCEEKQGNELVRITTLKLPPYRIAEIDPASAYKVANVGDNVTLVMKELVMKQKTVLWLKNGTTEMPNWTNQLEVTIANVSKDDQGIYECFYDGERSNSLHGIMRLIVRGCPANLYGPGCTQDCQACYNGGICHDVTGVCICSPGFTGDQCERACGGNKFGADCEQICYKQPAGFPAAAQNLESGCKFFTFCKIDPYGCRCAPGFQGTTCDSDCKPGFYGADCTEQCHCQNNSPCNAITGKCPDRCERGWFGASCQIFKDSTLRPNITIARDSIINVGSKTDISCLAEGYPAPFVTLAYSNGTEVTDAVWKSNETRAEVSSVLTGEASGLITIMCNASNIHGVALAEMKITVVEPPTILTQPLLANRTSDSLIVQWFNWEYGKDAGGAATDRPQCKAIYRPVGTSEWLESAGYSDKNITVISRLRPNTEHKVAVVCRRDGDNGNGTSGPLATFKTGCGVATSESAPTLQISNSTASSLTITWNKPKEDALKCDVLEYLLLYNVVLKPSTLKSVELNTTMPTVYVIKNLLPYTRYSIKLMPRTSKELSKFPAVVSSLTAESTPGKVGNIKKKYTSSYDNVILSWSEPPLKNGIILSYRLKYSLLNEGMCGDSVNPFNEVTTSDNSVVIGQLKPYSSYQIYVEAATRVGYGVQEEYSFMTLQSDPEVAPSNVRAIRVTSTDVEVSWDVIPCLQRNGRIAAYEYEVAGNDDSSFQRSAYPLYNTTGNYARIENLLPNTNYRIRVRQYTDHGVGPFSPALQFTTSFAKPDTPKLKTSEVDSQFVVVEWKKPPAYAPVATYEIAYRPAAAVTINDSAIVTMDSPTSAKPTYAYNVTKLVPVTSYIFQIRARSSAGASNWSQELIVKTLEEKGPAPFNIILIKRKDIALGISWSAPESNKSVIVGYKIVFKPLAVDSDEVYLPLGVTVDNGTTDVTVGNLMPDTSYSIVIYTLTKRGIGNSASAVFRTKIRVSRNAPIPTVHTDKAYNNKVPMSFTVANDSDVPRIFQIIVGKGNDVDIHDDELMDYENATDKNIPFYIAAQFDNLHVGFHRFIIGDGDNYGGYKNERIAYGHLHNVWIRVIFITEDGNVTALSPSGKSIFFEARAKSVVPVNNLKVFGFPLLYLILLILGALILIILISFLVAHIIRRHQLSKQSGAYTVSDGINRSNSWQVTYSASDANVTVDANDQYPLFAKPAKYTKKDFFRKSSKKKNNGIPIEVFPDYVKQKLLSYNDNFSHEFKLLPFDQHFAWSCAKKPENIQKNRYGNILPYDHSRVILKHKSHDTDEDYINANYIDGMYKKKEYIVTQGPKPNTAADFWKMVWQEKSLAIVMVTDLVENNKPKCSQYWPNESKYYDNIQVMQIHKEDHAEFKVLTFLIRKTKIEETRRVVLYWYIDWLDKSVPDDTSMLLKMHKMLRSDIAANHGPIIVHCSAGVGRAGTFVAIDALCQQAEREKRVNIFEYVKKIRNQRMNLVQTDEQYVFVHEALLEAIVTKDTEIPMEKLPLYINTLNSVSETGLTGMQHQYSMIARLADKQLRTGNRASLLPFIDDESSLDLPDTMLISGYEKKKAYLVTSTPVKDTAAEFWSMVYRHKSSVIVMLNELQSAECSDRVTYYYWPKEGCCRYGSLEVQIVTFEAAKHVHVRTMKVINTKLTDAKPHVVIHLQYFDWPESMLTPASNKSIVSLIDLIYRWNMRISNAGPITIHCRDGVSQSGLICAVATIKQEINASGSVDVFKICKRLCSTHIDFISTMEQYKFCYEVALYLYKSNSYYA